MTRTVGCIEKEERRKNNNWLFSGPPHSEGGHCGVRLMCSRAGVWLEDAQDKITNSVHTLKAPSATRGMGACVGIGAFTFASVFEEEEGQRARRDVADP